MMRDHKDRLFSDNAKYAGKYVATPSFSDRTIVSSASTMAGVIEKASKKGYKDPVVIKIPQKGTKFLF